MAAATTTPRKPRERRYFEMVGTAAGSAVRLTPYSEEVLKDAAQVLGVLATAGAVFPRANGLLAELEAFKHNPTAKAESA